MQKYLKCLNFSLVIIPNDSRTNVYEIFASIPTLGLNLGYKVATIPNIELSIQNNSSTYTVYDQYNHKELLTLNKDK